MTPGPAAAGASAGSDPLSAAQKSALDDAAGRVRAILKPARVATVNAWTIGIFGAITVLWGLVSGGGGVVVGALLLAVAWNEKRGRDRLRALDPEGATILGWNQVALAAVVTAYCLVAIVRAHVAPSASMQELEDAAGFSADLVAQITTLVYGAVIVGVVASQAFLARWHFRRRAMVEAFRQKTPPWVVEVLVRAGKGVA